MGLPEMVQELENIGLITFQGHCNIVRRGHYSTKTPLLSGFCFQISAIFILTFSFFFLASISVIKGRVSNLSARDWGTMYDY